MDQVSRLLTTPACSKQVIPVRARWNNLTSRLPPVRPGPNNSITCSWRFPSCTALRNAGLATTESATKVAKPKIKSEELRRLLGLAKSDNLHSFTILSGGITLLFVSSAKTVPTPLLPARTSTSTTGPIKSLWWRGLQVSLLFLSASSFWELLAILALLTSWVSQQNRESLKH